MCLQAYRVKVSLGKQYQETVEVTDKSFLRALALEHEQNKTSDWSFGWGNVSSSFNVYPTDRYQWFTDANGWNTDMHEAIARLMLGQVFASRYASSGGIQYFRYSYTSEYIRSIWKASSDPDPWIKNIAVAMTNAMRRSSPAPPNPYYRGTALETKVVILVNWPWVAFPATVFLLAATFLGVTIYQTRRSNIPVWKDSALALLFLKLDPTIYDMGKHHMDIPGGVCFPFTSIYSRIIAINFFFNKLSNCSHSSIHLTN